MNRCPTKGGPTPPPTPDCVENRITTPCSFLNPPTYNPLPTNKFACPCNPILAGQLVFDVTAGCYVVTNYPESLCGNPAVCPLQGVCCPSFAFAKLWWDCR